MSILEKINVADIVGEHFASLRQEGSPRTSWDDVALFYGLPAAIVAGFIIAGTQLSSGTIGVLTTALSVIAGLLFNLLVLLHSMKWTETREPFAGQLKRFLNQLHANIAYAIVIALLTIAPLVIGSNFEGNSPGGLICAYLAIYMAVHFGLTMLMVLKRMHIALQYRLNEPKP
jgi:hypothetical protein